MWGLHLRSVSELGGKIVLEPQGSTMFASARISNGCYISEVGIHSTEYLDVSGNEKTCVIPRFLDTASWK